MNDDDQQPEEESPRELVMPFVSVASVGGPHDDQAFVAGYEMGLMDARLAAMVDSITACQFTILSDNRDQADLLAMRYGFDMHVEDDTLGWTYVTMQRCPDS